MKASTRFGLPIAFALACSLAAAQLQNTYSIGVSLAIPPSGTGGAGCYTGSPNQTEVTLNVADAFVISHVRVQLDLVHTYVGDLTMTLRHCGTSVVLYDRSPNSSSDLNGWYAFNDQAVLPFASIVTAPGVIPSDDYLPVNSLAPFFGTSSAGAWTISICDQGFGDVGHISSMSLTLSGAQTYGGAVSPPMPIPDGNGGCVIPIGRAINVPTSGIVDAVTVTLGLSHPFVRDLDVAISHDGVVVALVAASTVAPGVGAQGVYTFRDSMGFIQPFVAAGSGVPAGSSITPGTYGPATPLSAFAGHSKQGVWLVTICDTQASDVGSLTSASVTLSDSAYDLVLSQPNGAASLVFKNEGGVPGHTFVNLATIVPGSFPYGWLNGLDISLNDILFQVGVGAPLTGTLGACGTTTASINGPIPPALSIQFVSFELDASGTPVASKRAFQYVTQ